MEPPRGSEAPIRKGGLLAVLAAICFGVTTPLIQRLGRGAGPVPTATLLYAGAALASLRRYGGAAARHLCGCATSGASSWWRSSALFSLR